MLKSSHRIGISNHLTNKKLISKIQYRRGLEDGSKVGGSGTLLFLHPTGTPSQSSEEQSEQPTEFQLIQSLEAKGCRGLLKTNGKEVLEADGRVPRPCPSDLAALAVLEQSQVSDCEFAAPSLPKVASSQTCSGRNLDA